MQSSCKTNDAGQLLRAAGLRRTRARQTVLAALTSSARPMTPQQIASLADTDQFDKVTTYRTLSTLKSAGLLHVVLGADGSARYCANASEPRCPGGHVHFQCLECGEMRCVHDQRLPRISMKEAVVVKAKQLIAFGLCARCAKASVRTASKRHRKRQEVTE